MENTIVIKDYTTRTGQNKYETVEFDSETGKLYQYKYYGKYISSQKQLNKIIDNLVIDKGFIADTLSEGLEKILIFKSPTDPYTYYKYNSTTKYIYKFTKHYIGYTV